MSNFSKKLLCLGFQNAITMQRSYQSVLLAIIMFSLAVTKISNPTERRGYTVSSFN